MVVDLNSKDNITHLINKFTYWQFENKTMREHIEQTKMDCFENTDESGKHPNKLGYKLISEEFYNYIVKNGIL
jgi:lysophospholipase L1-like esterase